MNGKKSRVAGGSRADSELREGAGIVRRFRGWWDRQQTAQRALALDPLERKRMAWDLGTGPTDLRQLTASPQSGETLLPVMMARFRIDSADLGPTASGALRDMRRVCSTCPAKRQCTHALTAGASADECRRFCLNAETLLSLAPVGVSHQPGHH